MNKNVKITVIIVGAAVVVAIQSNLDFFKNSNNGSQKPVDNTNVKANIQEYLNTNKWKTYETNSFSFKYSENFKITSALNEGSEIITAEDDKFGFQIFIMSFDEPGPINKERILQDVPDMQINNPGQAKLDGIETLIFNGYNEDMGETFEAWVVYKGKLYQIMTKREQEKLLEEVLETWKWK